MTNEEFKLSLFENINFFIEIAEKNQQIEMNQQNKIILMDFRTMIILLRNSALDEYVLAKKNNDAMVISYLEKFLQKIINLVNIAKSTNDNQKLAPAIEGLINLASPSENRTIRFNTSISAIGIIGGIVGFTLGFIIGVPLGLMLGAIFGGIPMIVLGSSIPMLAIGYFAGCGLLGGLALGISGAEKFYESCTGNSVTTFTYNPLSEFEQQKTKTFNTNIFCRLFKDRKIEPESKERHNENRDDETMTKQAIGIR